MKPTILSTKVLTLPQRELLLNAGLGLVEHDFIRTEEILWEQPPEVKNLIFTSQNAVHYYLKKTSIKNTVTFCVGRKTAAILQKEGAEVLLIADNAALLAQQIMEQYNERSFTFVCGQSRRDELPKTLLQHHIPFTELIVYQTVPTPITLVRTFEGILFFSPSGVQSYLKRNKIGQQACFCIGDTTATTLNNLATTTFVATKPSVESTIVKAVQQLTLIYGKNQTKHL